MALCDANTLIAEACSSGFTCRNEPELLAILNQLLCNYSAGGGGGSGLGYTMAFQYRVSGIPVDSTTYFFGEDNALALTAQTTYALTSLQIPKAGTIKRVFVKVRIGSPLGTSETVQHFIRLNDTTDVGQVDLAYDAVQVSGTNTTVNQAVVAGDMVALKVVCPAWVTNPTVSGWYAMIYVE